MIIDLGLDFRLMIYTTLVGQALVREIKSVRELLTH